ncbi:MAG: electron transfer flavoprotein subunit beta/FixA family protein [Arenicella sp.]
MKILVPIKRVVDANVRVRVKADNSGVDVDAVKHVINPFCEIAIEEAIRLKESGAASEVIVVSAGSDSCQEQLRTALALGADRAIQLATDQVLQPLAIAKLLNSVVKKENPSLIILGKQSIDGDNNQTGQMLAALAGMPQGTFASKLELTTEFGNTEVQVTREVDGGLQQVALTLPAVITTDLRLNEPRYVSLPNMMKAKRKPIERLEVEELGVDISPRLETVTINNPPERSAGQIVGSVTELVEKLKSEAGVL